MSLENLVGRTLERHECTREEVARLLAAARRNLRDAADYSGEETSEEEAAACLRAARALLDDVSAWLKKHRSELT